jgi:hypothetical protein
MTGSGAAGTGEGYGGDAAEGGQRATSQLWGAFQEALDEARYWTKRCAAWERAHGKGIWAEGHPADREKLEQRREWRRRAVIERRFLRAALRQFGGAPQ